MDTTTIQFELKGESVMLLHEQNPIIPAVHSKIQLRTGPMADEQIIREYIVTEVCHCYKARHVGSVWYHSTVFITLQPWEA